MSVVVGRIPIIGTHTIRFIAYEPDERAYGPHGSHSTITTIMGKSYGTICSRRLTPELDKLPARSDERSKKVRAFQEANYQEAYKAILKAFPEARGGDPSMGEITTDDGDPKRYGTVYRDLNTGHDLMKESTFLKDRRKPLTEGRDRAFQNILRMWCINVTTGRKWTGGEQEWLTRPAHPSWGQKEHVHGKMTLQNLEMEIRAFEDSTKPGGVNAHLGPTKVYHAELIKGPSVNGSPTVTYDMPKFQVLEGMARPKSSFKRHLAENQLNVTPVNTAVDMKGDIVRVGDTVLYGKDRRHEFPNQQKELLIVKKLYINAGVTYIHATKADYPGGKTGLTYASDEFTRVAGRDTGVRAGAGLKEGVEAGGSEFYGGAGAKDSGVSEGMNTCPNCGADVTGNYCDRCDTKIREGTGGYRSDGFAGNELPEDEMLGKVQAVEGAGSVHTAKFDRAVSHIKAKGDVNNPYAVAQAALGSKAIKTSHQEARAIFDRFIISENNK